MGSEKKESKDLPQVQKSVLEQEAGSSAKKERSITNYNQFKNYMKTVYTLVGKCLVALAATYIGIFAFWFVSMTSCQMNYGSCGGDTMSKMVEIIYPI